MFVNEIHHGGIRALLDYDNTIFDNMVVPDGVNLAAVVDNILFVCGDTPLFAPDPAVIKYYIGKWSQKRIDQWQRYYNAINLVYDPIENYNRYEEITRNNIHGHKINRDEKTDTENTTSADNSTTYQPDNKTNVNNTGNETHSGTDTDKTTAHIHGNIGVTTSQQMLQSELNLIPEINIIDFITDDFKNEFCLFIY